MIENITIAFYTLSRREIILVLILCVTIFIIGSKRFSHRVWWKFLMAVCLIGAACFVAATTVYTRTPGSVQGTLNLTPFHAYYLYFSGQQSEAMRSCLMNMILFVPLGLFAGELLPKKWALWKRVLLITAIGCAFSIFIEYQQYALQCGEAEVDDVINNTIGALVGSICVPAISQLWERKTRRNVCG